MGTLKWAAYKPENINWKARSLAEAYSRDGHEPLIEPQNIKVRASSGAIFCIAMLVMAVATYFIFLG